MPNQKTRKQRQAQRGGVSFWNRLRGNPRTVENLTRARNKRIAQAKRDNAYDRTHKARTEVANWMPGAEQVSTERKRLAANRAEKIAAIEAEFQSAVADIQNEKLEQVKSSLEELQEKLQQALESNAAKKTASAIHVVGRGTAKAVDVAGRELGSVVITLPIGVAQVAYKALRVFIAFCVFWIGLGGEMMGFTNAIATLIEKAAPNANFTTTGKVYNWARGFTGANKKKEEERARQEAEQRARQEAEQRARQEAEERARQEAEERARQEAEERARQEAEERARQEAEAEQRSKKQGRHFPASTSPPKGPFFL